MKHGISRIKAEIPSVFIPWLRFLVRRLAGVYSSRAA
jgi:hypothetical protein